MTASEYRHNLGLEFAHVASVHADAPALRFPDATTVTYAELATVADQVAATLKDRGIGRRDVVAILADKTVEGYATMLACLKVGAVYTNLDLSSPWTRLSKMVDRCAPSLAVYDSVGDDILAGFAACGVPTLDLRSALRSEPTSSSRGSPMLNRDVTGADPAYIMFTSGSTGIPKGVVISHANVLNFIDWAKTTFGVGPGDILTNVNPLYFDNSVFDVYASLFSGAAMCPISTEQVEQPRDIVRTAEDARCTIWFSVPSMLVYLLTTRALEPGALPSLRMIVFGGEGFPKPKLAQLSELFAGRAQLVNVYGPTECTCICSSYVIDAEDVANQSELAPLGHLAPNFDYMIEPIEDDPDFGVLHLGGPNVGLGYYNDPERTAEAFQPAPHLPAFRSTFYRTGDLVRRSAEGMLHFAGRADNQIKHMGYRIELEEIDAGLNVLPYVREAATVYEQEASKAGAIVAYLAVTDAPERATILSDLAGILPRYMLPRRIHLLDELPKNRNGKIDRGALSGGER
jgi:D-alanine--poly(phosphoribitol) ligase subunit 1